MKKVSPIIQCSMFGVSVPRLTLLKSEQSHFIDYESHNNIMIPIYAFIWTAVHVNVSIFLVLVFVCLPMELPIYAFVWNAVHVNTSIFLLLVFVCLHIVLPICFTYENEVHVIRVNLFISLRSLYVIYLVF